MSESQSPEDTPAENPATPTPSGTDHVMIRQAHGGSLKRLIKGSRTNPGAGLSPLKIKLELRKDFRKTAPMLKDFALGLKKDENGNLVDAGISVRDRIRAIDIMGKYAMDSNVTLADVREALRLTRAVIDEFLPREQADVLWQAIMPHWLKL